jgi:hypothetical protein
VEVLELLVCAREFNRFFGPVCLRCDDADKEEGGVDVVEVPGFDDVVEPPGDTGQEGRPETGPCHCRKERGRGRGREGESE